MNQAPLFDLGVILATPAAKQDLEDAEMPAWVLLHLHAKGEWGNVPPEDAAANDQAAKVGERILSAYELPNGRKLWIITEPDRSATTILRPEDY